MKKTLLLSFGVAFAAATTSATTLTPEQALARLISEGPQRIASSREMSGLRLQTAVGNLYVFAGNGGFALLPSDDAAPALLAYSDKGEMDIAGNPGVSFWMEYYNNSSLKNRHIG